MKLLLFSEFMTQVYDLFLKGGPVMWPLLALSIFTVTIALERAWFWIRLLSQENRIVHDVLETARYDLREAQKVAQHARFLPIGRFLLAPLQLNKPTPETFRLAMEGRGDKEFTQMRKGDKFLETVIAVAPLLGLLGTVTGLITTFNNLEIGEGTNIADTSQAASGISEALITTASGMIVAILALLIYRISVTLQGGQVDYFAEVGTELELIYRQIWYEPTLEKKQDLSTALPPASSVNVDTY